jgi:pyrroline-5-carboxylate reductase
MNVGILGCGTIGRALARGLLSHPRVARVAATTRTPRAHFPDLPELVALESNNELAATSDVIVLCVKPSQMEGVVREIAGELQPDVLLISIAAGVSTAAVRGWSTKKCGVVRAMPNMPCRIREGMSALAPGDGATGEDLETARDLFSTLGRVCTVEERLMDAVTAISGCGPAYVYLIIEALAEAGVSLGVPRATALELAAQTLRGAATMVLTSGAHPAALRDEVTTPGGCTIDGLLALEDGGLRSTLVRAVAAAAARSAQLAG